METNNNKTTFDEMERFCAVRRVWRYNFYALRTVIYSI